jgi:transcriptional regulator with GAF, ATPase, and Fis domain
MERNSFYNKIKEYEKTLICEALAQTNGNQAQAAKILGLTPTTLSSLIQRLGIDTKAFRRPKDTISFETFEKFCLWRSGRP